MTPDPDALDELFRALASERRRLCVACLAEVPTPIGVEELARRLAGTDGPHPTGGACDAPARELRVMLRHRDLPLLVEADVLEWTDDAVAPGPRFPTAEACLEATVSAWNVPDE